jgi:cell division protein FtsI/penicillin-binding protein 2
LKQRYDTRSREDRLLYFFCALLLLVFSRLFFLQIVKGDYYQQILIDQHFSKSSLDAARGNIFVKDRADKSMQLTENINVYNLFVDPNFLPNKSLFIEEFTPIIYDHFCVQFGMQTPSKLECVQRLEKFSQQQLLPERQIFFYGGEMAFSGELYSGTTQYEVDQEYAIEVEKILS